MDPVSILCLSIISGYAIYRRTNNKNSIKMHISPNEYHELCRQNSFKSFVYDDIIEKFRKSTKMTSSFVISELAFNQLFVFNRKQNNTKSDKEKNDEKKNDNDDNEKKQKNNNNKLTSFYLTLNESINEEKNTMKTHIWIDKNIKFDVNDDMKKLYIVEKIKMDNFNYTWKDFENNSETQFQQKGIVK
jgi:hypothetical protein